MICPLMKGLKMSLNWWVKVNINVSYDTTGNNTIMFHRSLHENSKTNSNLKNERERQREREVEVETKTMMLSMLRLGTKLL